jgi:hypothetical protein
MSLKNGHRVVTHHEEPLLVCVLFLGVEGIAKEHLDVAVLIIGETALVLQHSEDLLALL